MLLASYDVIDPHINRVPTWTIPAATSASFESEGILQLRKRELPDARCISEMISNLTLYSSARVRRENTQT